MSKRPVLRITVATVLLAALGCGSQATSQPNRDSLRAVVVLYRQYMAEHGGRRPHDEASFKEFVAARGGEVLKAHGVSSPETLFAASRDGQPLQIVYAKAAGRSPRVIVYERNGIDGQRMVADSLGVVGLANEAEFKEMMGVGVEGARVPGEG